MSFNVRGNPALLMVFAPATDVMVRRQKDGKSASVAWGQTTAMAPSGLDVAIFPEDGNNTERMCSTYSQRIENTAIYNETLKFVILHVCETRCGLELVNCC